MPIRTLALIPILAFGATVCAQPLEVLVYAPGSGERVVDRFAEHADAIDVIAPQAYRVTAAGRLVGGVHPDLLRVAAERDVRVMPLFVNGGFNQDSVHVLLADPAARMRAVRGLVDEGREHGYWGWQFDLENIHVSMRDSVTAFYREASKALGRAGLALSIAVVPTDGSEGESPFARYMQDNWRNSFDVAALARDGDFVTWMTYAQHGGITAPGPIAGLPWMRRLVAHLERESVPLDRISLGLPFYSGWWEPTYREADSLRAADARVRGREISHERAWDILDRAAAFPVWDASQGVSMAWWENEGTFQWIFLEDARSLRAKLDYARTLRGLRGVSIWVLGSEDPAVWDVLRAARADRN